LSAPNLDSEAENLLKKFGYVWSDRLYAYRRARRVDRQSTQEYLAAPPILVTYEELRDHGLAVPQYDPGAESPTPAQRRAAIQWLHNILSQNESL
jgi:hypothetical protein